MSELTITETDIQKCVDFLKQLWEDIKPALEEVFKALTDFIHSVLPFIIAMKREENRIANLSLHSNKFRTRKKNMKRLRELLE
jgi:hypothetical protein